MKKYRRKTKLCEAMQYDKYNGAEIIAWLRESGFLASEYINAAISDNKFLRIANQRNVYLNIWIVKGEKLEYWATDVFNELYSEERSHE